VISARSTGSDNTIDFLINGETTSSGSLVELVGSGSAVTSTSYSSLPFMTARRVTVPSTYTANTFSNVSFYFTNYTSTVAKSISIDGVQENNATESYQNITAELWDNTSPITSLLFDNSTFAEFSTASLYKITAD
jgi:hypothetical protein